MRPKVLIAIVVISSLFLGLLMLARKPAPTVRNDQLENEAITASSRSANLKRNRATPQVTAVGAAINPADQQPDVHDENTPNAQHQAYVEKRIEELTDLAMTDDRGSLDIILSELNNRDPEIRKAALDASVQFGSRDAIPKLTDVVSQVDDPKEKAGILEAIEFLKLPSATEVIAQGGGLKTRAKLPIKPPNPINPTPATLAK